MGSLERQMLHRKVVNADRRGGGASEEELGVRGRFRRLQRAALAWYVTTAIGGLANPGSIRLP